MWINCFQKYIKEHFEINNLSLKIRNLTSMFIQVSKRYFLQQLVVKLLRGCLFLLILFPRLFSVRKLKWHCKIHDNIIKKNKGHLKNNFILTFSGFRNKSLTPSGNEDSIDDISTRNWFRLIFGHHRFDVGLKRKKKIFI